jgi:L-threonylcarbamoyladenylate synthase
MPSTIHLDASSPGDIAHAADLLQQGLLVAFATETVYGLGANALNPEAVAAIFAAKRRPHWDPLIVHLAAVEQLPQIAKVPPELALRIEKLARTFWPGPLTLLLPRNQTISDAVTAGRDLVGVRIPAHPAAQALLLASKLPIAAPSANLFGHTSPTTAAHVLADLDGRIDAVLDAGPTNIGVESTVLDPTQTPMILYRPGAVTAAQLTEATGIDVHIFVPAELGTEPESLPSPGVGLRHYAPRARLVLVETTGPSLHRGLLEQTEQERSAGLRVGIMLPEGWPLLPDTVAFHWGKWSDPVALAHNLFAALRKLDDLGVDVSLAPMPPPGGLNDAIRDRLIKASIPR